MLTGSCLCGDIAFAIDGPIEEMTHCHCSMCRKFHGSAFATFGMAAPADYRWVRGEARVRSYRSSSQGCRHFCPRCGSAVPSHGDDSPNTIIPMGNVAEEPVARPQRHIFIGSMAPWHQIVDDLPQHEAYPPEFGPDAVTVARPDRQPRTTGATAGSCLCGAVAFEFGGPPLRIYNCHCSRCRRAVSGAYQTLIRANRNGFRWLTGDGLRCRVPASGMPVSMRVLPHLRRSHALGPRSAGCNSRRQLGQRSRRRTERQHLRGFACGLDSARFGHEDLVGRR